MSDVNYKIMNATKPSVSNVKENISHIQILNRKCEFRLPTYMDVVHLGLSTIYFVIFNV